MAGGATFTPGMTHVREYVVTKGMTAHAGGNRGFHVLSGPALIQEFELACIELVHPLLKSGEATVGISFDLRHLAASPVGIRVSTTAVLQDIDGRTLTFAVQAHDERCKIGEGTHERMVVDIERFLSRTTGSKNDDRRGAYS